ncbi:MAG: methionyl-tRNA formyltransferase [Zoogloeaceae bacterium]|jgi:methionyl-tRNA formyltransferase|nr:methionyl-tRNA formyltransferase [Zoogloeaceae bacterium]
MKLIFAGTPAFAVTALAALIDAGHTIALVLTQPDRPAGRGMRPMPSPVKQLALAHRLDVFQPASLRENADALARLAALEADAMIVVAYGLILPHAILDLPRLGCFNVHASLLPRWRGAAPIQRAILAGDKKTGVCVMQMEAGLDSGPVLAHTETCIQPEETAATLHDRLADMGARLLVETLPRLPLVAAPQTMTGVTYAARIEKAEALLDWTRSAIELDRRIRAFNPFPVAQTIWRNAPLKIWRACPVLRQNTVDPGTVLAATRQGITVACGEDALLLTELQKAGGRRIAAAQFIAGHALTVGEKCFGNAIQNTTDAELLPVIDRAHEP